MYHAIAGDKVFIIPSLHPDKANAVALVKVLFAKHKVDRYVFMDEAWILEAHDRIPSREEMQRIQREGLEHHPDRREILMFSAEDRRGNRLMAHRFILRPERGKAKLSPLKVIDWTEGETKGRMVGLLRS